MAFGEIRSRKYLSDYDVRQISDENGRIRKVPVYTAEWYTFRNGFEKANAFAKIMFRCSLAGWVLFIAPLATQSLFANTIYSALPFLFIMIPLWQLSFAMWRAENLHGPFERQYSDEINKTHLESGFGLICALLTLAGEVLTMVLRKGEQLQFGDILFGIGSLYFVYYFYRIRRNKRTLITEMDINTPRNKLAPDDAFDGETETESEEGEENT